MRSTIQLLHGAAAFALTTWNEVCAGEREAGSMGLFAARNKYVCRQWQRHRLMQPQDSISHPHVFVRRPQIYMVVDQFNS